MEVRAGYKQTDIGVIPEDWEVRTLNSLGKRGRPAIKAGPFGSSLTKDTYVSDGYKVYGQEQVIRGNHLYGDYYISKSRFNKLKSCAVEPGDILLSLVGTAGRVLIIPEGAPEGIINPRLIRFSFDRKTISSTFFKYLFETETYQALLSRNAQGGTMGVLNAGLLKPICIPIPSPTEQEAIAKALSDADAFIETLEQLIAKKRQVKQGAMQELLTGKKRLLGFSGEWVIREIGDLGLDISDGNYSSMYPKQSDFKETGVPFIRANNISKMKVIDDDMRFISADQHNVLLKGHLKKDDILITTRGDLGNIALVPERHIGSNINAQIVRINTRQLINHTYLAFFLSHDDVQKKIKGAETGSALKQLPVGKLVKIQVALPTFPEQTAIAEILSDMDAEIAALEAKLARSSRA